MDLTALHRGPVGRGEMRYYTDLVPAFPDQDDWTLATVLRTHAARRPDAVLLDLPEEGLTFTYAQALEQAESVADRLAEAGARTGDRVLVMAANSSQFLRTWLGTGVGGTVEVPVNTAYEGVFLEHQVATAAPRFAVIDDVQAAKFPAAGDAARADVLLRPGGGQPAAADPGRRLLHLHAAVPRQRPVHGRLPGPDRRR